MQNRTIPTRNRRTGSRSPEQPPEEPHDRPPERPQAEAESLDRLRRRVLHGAGGHGRGWPVRPRLGRPRRPLDGVGTGAFVAPGATQRAGGPGLRLRPDVRLQAVGELLGQADRDVLDHPAPVLRGGPGDREVLLERDVGAALDLVHGRDDRGGGRPPAALLAPVRLQHDAVGLIVPLLQLHRAGERHAHGPELDGNLSLPCRLVHDLGELRARHAGRHLLHVEDVGPHVLHVCRHDELVLDLHVRRVPSAVSSGPARCWAAGPAVSGRRVLRLPPAAGAATMGRMSPPDAPRKAPPERQVQAMFDDIVERYDLVNGLLSLGLDGGWRRAAIRAVHLEPGDRALDLGCGTGDLTLGTLRTSPWSLATGVDISHAMLSAARRRAETDANGASASFVRGSAFRLPFRDGAFAGAVSGFVLRNLDDLPGAFAELARVIRPGGRIGLVDVTEPRNRALRRLFDAYFGVAAPALGAMVGKRDAYRYLARSLAQLPSPERVSAML